LGEISLAIFKKKENTHCSQIFLKKKTHTVLKFAKICRRRKIKMWMLGSPFFIYLLFIILFFWGEVI